MTNWQAHAQDRRDRGQCYDCQLPAALGKRRCPEHLRRASLRAREKYLRGRPPTTDVRRAHFAGWKRQSIRRAGRYGYVRSIAKRKGREWSITREEYAALIASPCYYCGLENTVETGIGLDRLDNGQGYTLENVVSCCGLCNYVRADRFTPEEMLLVGRAVRQVRIGREGEPG